MTITLHMGLQLAAFIVQVLNWLTPIVPDSWKPIIATVVSVVQIVIGMLAHLSNPDGTPTTQAWDGAISKAKK
jgi:hypothetical protein